MNGLPGREVVTLEAALSDFHPVVRSGFRVWEREASLDPHDREEPRRRLASGPSSFAWTVGEGRFGGSIVN